MSECREAVEALCKCLTYCLGVKNLSAEILRKAKHNHDSVTPIMWQALLDLLKYSTSQQMLPEDKFVKTFHEFNVGEVKLARSGSTVMCEVVGCVKQSFVEFGYSSADFEHLPTDGSKGSLELLLALAWYLVTVKPVENYVTRYTNKSAILDIFTNLQRTSSSCKDGDTKIITNFSHFSEVSGSICREGNSQFTLSKKLPQREHTCATLVSTCSGKEHFHSLGVQEKANYYAWLHGKMMLSLRQLHSMLREYFTLIHRGSEQAACLICQQPYSTTSLRLLHILLTENPAKLVDYLRLLKEENTSMAIILKWKSREAIFWKWMISVVESKSSEENRDASSAPHSKLNTDKINIEEHSRRDTGIGKSSSEECFERLLEDFMATDYVYVDRSKGHSNYVRELKTANEVKKNIPLHASAACLSLEDAIRNIKSDLNRLNPDKVKQVLKSSLNSKFSDVLEIQPIKK